MKIQHTPRGFAYVEGTDRYGYKFTLQKSSLASEDAIWFGVDDVSPQIMACDAASCGVSTAEITGWVPFPIPEAVSLYSRMHLTRAQVAELLPVLQRFVDTGEIT